MTLVTPAALNILYKIGIVGQKLCARRLMELRIVPPYHEVITARGKSKATKVNSTLWLI